MWDRLPVTLVTVLKPLLRSMSGIVKVSCPFTGSTHTHSSSAELKGSAHLYKTSLSISAARGPSVSVDEMEEG